MFLSNRKGVSLALLFSILFLSMSNDLQSSCLNEVDESTHPCCEMQGMSESNVKDTILSSVCRCDMSKTTAAQHSTVNLALVESTLTKNKNTVAHIASDEIQSDLHSSICSGAALVHNGTGYLQPSAKIYILTSSLLI
jgi:hypothetical protein